MLPWKGWEWYLVKVGWFYQCTGVILFSPSIIMYCEVGCCLEIVYKHLNTWVHVGPSKPVCEISHIYLLGSLRY